MPLRSTPPAGLVRSLPLLFALLCGAALADSASPSVSWSAIAQYAHATDAFTQGLEIADDALYESSGLYGRSFIARGPLPGSAAPVQATRRPLPATVFAEGLTVWGDRIYVATWRERRGLIFARDTLEPVGEFALPGEGWGLTHDDTHLILSDGSATLQFIDPANHVVRRKLTVHEHGRPVERLNELEWIDGVPGQPARLLANIWQTDELVAIDPADGRVTARLDLRRLYPAGRRGPTTDVMNGIAFDRRDGTLLVTGKLWPRLYRIRLAQPLP